MTDDALETMDVRAPTAADRDAVLHTVRAAELLADEGVAEVAEELDALLAGVPAAGTWLIGVRGDAVLAVAFFIAERMTNGTWNLLMLAVHPDHQSRGHGAALVAAVERHVQGLGARLLVVETSGVPDFAGQRRFYERLGYRQQGWIEDFFDAGDAKVVYTRSLAAPERDGTPTGATLTGATLTGAGVREARVEDLPGLADLAAAFYAEDGFTTTADDLTAHLDVLVRANDAHIAVVPEAHSRGLAAFAVTTMKFGLENGPVAELEDLYVTPARRRTGLGVELVEDAAAWARHRGNHILDVVIAPNGRDVEALHRYYAARGFVDEGRRLVSRDLREADTLPPTPRPAT